MPYTGKDDPNLPENVKAMPDDKRAQFVAVFNSVMEKCDKDPKECESSAFAQANGVVNQQADAGTTDAGATDAGATDAGEKGLVKKLTELLKAVIDGLKEIVGGDASADTTPAETPVTQTYLKTGKDRAVAFPEVYNQVQGEINKTDPAGMLHDVYYDNDGVFAICSSVGKLYRIVLNIKDGLVTLGKWEEIGVTQSKRSLYHVVRTKEGRFRWITVSASAILNRSGEIDSRELFDNFIQRAEESGEYPIRIFYHSGEKFRVGQCDFLGRDENLLITSGLYDENNELALREIMARSKDPEYWGDSIGFVPMENPYLLQIGSARIPVYRKGKLEEISTLPEAEAAEYFTNCSIVKEVHRMLDKRQMDAFIKLFDGDEEAAKSWLNTNAAERNRQILDQGMITRAKAELNALLKREILPPEVPATQTPAKQTPVETPAQTPAQTPAEIPAQINTFELDEPAMDALAERVAQRIDLAGALTQAITQALTPINDEFGKFRTRLEALEHGQTEVATAVRSLSLDDETKKRLWLADAPEKKSTPVTFRPRLNRANPDAKPEDVLNKLPSY